jgi:transposase
MRKDKEYIFKLRQEGKSFRQIEKETGVSRATLTVWFKQISWSKHLISTKREEQVNAAKERVVRMNMVRKLKLQYHYAQAVSEAKKEFELYKNDPLFHAGLTVYKRKGDKASKNVIRLSNKDAHTHRVFIEFLEKYLYFPKGKLKFSILLYPGFDEEACKQYWIEELNLTKDQFHKSQTVKGREVTKRLHFGIGTTIISNTYAKKKLSTWIDLALVFQNAGMV